MSKLLSQCEQKREEVTKEFNKVPKICSKIKEDMTAIQKSIEKINQIKQSQSQSQSKSHNPLPEDPSNHKPEELIPEELFIKILIDNIINQIE